MNVIVHEKEAVWPYQRGSLVPGQRLFLPSFQGTVRWETETEQRDRMKTGEVSSLSVKYKNKLVKVVNTGRNVFCSFFNVLILYWTQL